MRNLTTTLLVGFLLLGFNSSYAQLTDQEIINMNGFKGAKFGMTKEAVEALPKYESLFDCPVKVVYTYYQNKLYKIKISTVDVETHLTAWKFLNKLESLFGTEGRQVASNGNQYFSRKYDSISVIIHYQSRDDEYRILGSASLNFEKLGVENAKQKEIVNKDKNDLLGN